MKVHCIFAMSFEDKNQTDDMVRLVAVCKNKISAYLLAKSLGIKIQKGVNRFNWNEEEKIVPQNKPEYILDTENFFTYRQIIREKNGKGNSWNLFKKFLKSF